MDDFNIRRPAKKEEYDKVLRPQKITDFIGQKPLIENLKIFIEAAKLRQEPLDHILLHGPPGLGKTTLSNIIANEMSSGFHLTSGPIIEKAGDLAGMLTKVKKGDVLFIDEIHRLSSTVEEYLYSALEDYRIDIMIDTGPNARTVQLKLAPFTLIGATTRSGLLTEPMRARFGINCRLEYYTTSVLKQIIQRSAKLLNVEIQEDASMEISRRSRGTPRIANNLLRRVRDFAQIKGNGIINFSIAKYALDALNIDNYGLDDMDNKILSIIINKFNGGPVGINTIAVAIGEDANTIEEVYEPYLIQQGFIDRTAKGRKITPLAYKHLDKIPPQNDLL